MQAPLPIHPDYFSSSVQDSYLPPTDAQNYTTGFSRGSSLAYPHPDYRYLLDRGELVPSRVCSSGLVGPTALDATGLGFAGNSLLNTSAFTGPEELPLYTQHQQHTWDWSTAPPPPGVGSEAGTGTGNHGEIIASAPFCAHAHQTEEAYFAVAKPSSDMPSAVCSPAPQLPTPAAMAVLLNPSSRSDVSLSGSLHDLSETAYKAPPPVAHLRNTRPSAASSTRNNNRLLVERVVATQEGGVPLVPESISREKKHACTMCHKRFDRPSTLRKHLLVHTGEKAFVCDTCGRRFGVASNLNRHVKRCILKPVHHPSPSTSKSSPSSSPPTSTTMGGGPNPDTTPYSATNTGRRDHGASASQAPYSTTSPSRGSTARASAAAAAASASASAAPLSTSTSTSEPTTAPPPPPLPKRRRRPPSPSQWVPATLRHFNLTSADTYRMPPVPLPPVHPDFPYEERDSWDENVGQAPYHPCAWKGRLPGPGLGHGLGLGGKDVRNLDLGGRGGTVLGRVLVF